MILHRAASAAAAAPALRLTFEQEKTLEMLPEPLRTQGAIEIDRVHSRLRWSFAAGPVLILADRRLRRWGPDQREEGAADPAIQALAGQMQAMITGDWNGLSTLFTAVPGTVADSVVFTPKDSVLARLLTRITVVFGGDGVPRQLDVESAGGDRTRYQFSAPDYSWRPDPARFVGP